MKTRSVQGDALTARQLELLERMSKLDPPAVIFGGYAEDAVIAGEVTRPHQDVDWLFPRSQLDLRLTQARELGFSEWETWGEAAPGEPFYLSGRNGDLSIDIGVSDVDDRGRNVLRVHSVAFEIDDGPAPAGYQVVLPADTFAHPPATLEGITVHVASPLALYQIRVGIASHGSFGPLSERHRATSERLREQVLDGRPEAGIAPVIEPLPSRP